LPLSPTIIMLGKNISSGERVVYVQGIYATQQNPAPPPAHLFQNSPSTKEK